MSQSPRLILIFLLSFVCTAPVTPADADAPAAHEPKPQQARRAKPKPSFPDFKKVIEDMQEVPVLGGDHGLMKLYRYDPSDKLRDQARLLARIPASLLNRDMLFTTSISRGPFAGWMWSDALVQWRIIGRQVVLVSPESRIVEDRGKPVGDAVKRTYLPVYLASLPIITMAGGDPVVDLSSLLISNVASLPIYGSPDRSLSQYAKIKVFPENILIDVDLVPAGRRGARRAIGVSYAFRRLPGLGGYKPRVADERVGYFTTVRQDWATQHSKRDTVVRYINRWRLEKRDPSLELSPPKKPIMFIIEKTVPLRWRRWVRAGIAEWNKAFEAIGYVGAIEVQQQTDDNEFAGYDPEDARYNFIRWIVTGQAFAMGPSRADPRTGELLDADIIFDDAFLRYTQREFGLFGPEGAATVAGPQLVQFLAQNPRFLPVKQRYGQAAEAYLREMAASLGTGSAGADPQSKFRRGMTIHYDHRDHCNIATGLQQQLAFSRLAMLGTPTGKEFPERLIGEVIKEVICHEVGHTLGLRHNFKASSWLSLDEVKRRRDETDEATTASVMDYNPVLFFPEDKDPEKIRHFISPTIGPYDYWAIEYGYRQPGPKDGGEGKLLQAIASRGTEREHAFATDEDTMWVNSPDPLVNRYDMSDQPIDWAKARVELVDTLMKNLKDWAVKKDEPSYRLRSVFATLMFERATNMQYVSRVVGGQYFNRNRAGDPDAKPPLVLVNPEDQRQALRYLDKTLFNDAFFRLNPALLNDLPSSRWWDWADLPNTRIDYPIHDIILAMQSFSLLNIVAPPVLQRVYDAELKTDASDKFTAAELIVSVRDMIWPQVSGDLDKDYTDADPLISSIQRNLQSQYLDFMLPYVETGMFRYMSADLHRMVRFSLRELSDRIGRTLEQGHTDLGWKIDFASRAHLTESKSKIDRALNATYITR